MVIIDNDSIEDDVIENIHTLSGLLKSKDPSSPAYDRIMSHLEMECIIFVNSEYTKRLIGRFRKE